MTRIGAAVPLQQVYIFLWFMRVAGTSCPQHALPRMLLRLIKRGVWQAHGSCSGRDASVTTASSSQLSECRSCQSS